VERFLSVKKLASFFGLHPVYKVSGDGIGGFRMSKRGRKEPRQILFMVTLTAIQSNPLIRGIYQEHIQKGDGKDGCYRALHAQNPENHLMACSNITVSLTRKLTVETGKRWFNATGA